MPQGQFLGPKGQYVYTSESGLKYVLTLDADLAGLAGTLTAYNPAAPGGAIVIPKRFKPRGVYWQGTATGFTNKRKFIVVGLSTDPIYSLDAPEALTIDGVAGKITGRRGEAISF